MTPIAWQDEGGGKWYRRSDGTVRSTVVAERIAHDGYTVTWNGPGKEATLTPIRNDEGAQVCGTCRSYEGGLCKFRFPGVTLPKRKSTGDTCDLWRGRQ